MIDYRTNKHVHRDEIHTYTNIKS